MLATGWTRETLGRQPARVVRMVAERIWTERMWRPDIVNAAHTPVGHQSSYSSLQAWADAKRAQLQAAEYVKLLESALWPEDGDGE